MVGTIPKASTGPIQIAQFVLNHRIEAVNRSVKVNGDNTEWANTDHALFVGSKGQAQGTLRCSADKDSVYFLIEVLDSYVQRNDNASIYISPVTEKNELTNQACRIKVSSRGLSLPRFMEEAGMQLIWEYL